MNRREPSIVLTEIVQSLSLAGDIETVTTLVARAAREISGADGTTFVLRDEDKCYYANEDAISPLWKGGRFPIANCISGWAMLNGKHVIIPDIYKDDRIPHDAYRPTFVKSLCMVPIRPEKSIGAIGNYWASGYVPTDEEVKLLQVLANSTSIALENLDLKRDIMKRGHEEESLIDRKKELEAAIHTLAHDLRNPLSTMVLLAEVLEENLSSNLTDELRGYFSSIQRTGRQANKQIKRMLSLYGVTHRKLEMERINLTIVTEEIAHALKAKSPERKIKFEIDAGLEAIADGVLIRVAMENLLGNAFKYTGKKTDALVQVKKAREYAGLTTFYVKDNGDGFEPNQAAQLFRPLVRLHQDRDFQGTGLGLASVARIIELHGGSVHAEGQKSVGATFFFDLPRATN